MKNFIFIFLIFLFICLSSSKELDLFKRNNWNSCINITTPYQSDPEPACVTFQVTSNCGGKMTFSIGGITLYDKEITVDFPPKIDIQYQGCALSLELVDINNAQGHFCVQLQATCGVIPIRSYSFGCVTDDLLKNCVGCPHNCTGNGACTNGVCTCFQNWSGFDCSERAPLYQFCSPVPYFDAEICINVRYGNCKMGYSFLINNNTISTFYVPVHQLVNNQSKNCFSYLGCDLCLNTKNFQGNTTSVYACLDLNINCFTSQDVNYGCFQQYGNFEWPCLNCPGNCSGNGQCQTDGSCICEVNYFGDSCQYLRCKDDCNGNGICNQGLCECFSNYVAPYCTSPNTKTPSTITPHHSSSSSEEHHEKEKHKKEVIIAIIVMLVIAGIVGGLVVFYRLKKKREQNTLHFASINDDE